MSFGNAIASYFAKYATFVGRARRSEYWFALLFTSLVSMAASILFPADAHGNPSSVSNLWSLATLIPTLAIGSRRLHDTGRSGKNLFWLLLPIVGWIILLVYVLEESKSDANQYGAPVK